ncbi:hypothetical protein AB0389_36020, partial [Streptomyces sp. NPDC093109]
PTPAQLSDATDDLPSDQDGVVTPDPTPLADPGISTPPNLSLDTSAPAPLPSPMTSPLSDSSSVTNYSDLDASTVFDGPSSVGSITTPSTPATSAPNSPSLAPYGQGTGKDGALHGEFDGNADQILGDVPSDLPSLSPDALPDALPDGTNADGTNTPDGLSRDTGAPGQHTPGTSPASSDAPRPRTESTPAPGEETGRETGQNDKQFTDAPQSDPAATPTGTPATTPGAISGTGQSTLGNSPAAPVNQDADHDVTQDVRETGQDALATPGEHTPAPQSALAHPTPDPVRPEQWRHRQEDAPATQLWTELPGTTPEADDTVVRTSVQRIEAEDGRWVRNLTLDLPVNFGEGFFASQLPELQNRMRGLLAAQVNTGLQLPRSGDQLNIDLNLVHKPDHPEAIELSTTAAAMPTESNQFDIRLYSDDPSLGNSERDRRQARNNATALRQVLRYAGVDVDPATLPPGPAIPLEYLQTVEDLTDFGPVVADHALSAPPVAVATMSSPGPATPAPPAAPAHITDPATDPAPLTASAFPTAADWNAPTATPARTRQASEPARTRVGNGLTITSVDAAEIPRSEVEDLVRAVPQSGPEWGRGAVRRRDLGDQGRSHGVAYFSDPDWGPRERSYQRLPELTHLVVWSEDGPGRPTGEVLPVPGGGPGERFFFARHGRAGGLSEAEGRDLAVRAAVSGYQDVYLLPCYTPGEQGARPDVDLGEWARAHGRTVHEVLGRSAVTESPDERFGPVLWHVQLSDTGDGGPVLHSHHPDGTVTETWGGGGARAQGITRPADSLWDASVAVTASPETVNDLKGLWDRAVEQEDGRRLTVTVDGGKVTAGDLMTAVLEQIGATDRAAEITLPKPKAGLAAGSTHKVLLSFNADGQRGTVSREIRVEARSVADSAPRPSALQQAVFDPETTLAENERKLDVGREFSAVVNGLIRNDPRTRDIRHPLVLSGAGQINLAFDSPRPMNDLDFRLAIPYVREYEDRINRALAERFPSAPGAPPNVLRKDDHDPRALSGRINGVEVTIGPSPKYEGTSVVEGIVVPSVVDSVVDKAYALAARVGGKKRDTDLFDLLWALGRHPGLETALAEELVKRRGAAYAARPPAGGKQDVTAQFGHVLGGLMGSKRARESLMAQWPRFGATPEDVVRLQRTLTDVADVFRAGPGPYRSLVVTAGNFTGDMFGLATALLLNPRLHVGVMTGPRHPDQVGPFIRKTITAPVHAQYTKAVARLDASTDLSPGRRADALARLTAQRDAELREQEARVHTLHSNDPHSVYTQAANGYTALPYAEMSPAVPLGLRSTRLQKPTWYATNEVAAQWGRQGHERAKVRAAWGLDTPRTGQVRRFLAARGVPEKGPYVVLWSRLSSRQEGEPHPQHDTSTTGLRQIIENLPPGTNVVIAGDSSRNDALEELADEYPNVHDLTEFWTGADWRKAFPGGTREDQMQVFDHLSQVSVGELKHLGFRSGNLEAYALIGHRVRYLEETGNRQGKRMETWHAPDIGYQRITVNKVPTLAGQWVVANAAVTGNEAPAPWWSELDGTSARDRLKTKALATFGIENSPARRGYDRLDLQAIGAYLRFPGPGVSTAGSRLALTPQDQEGHERAIGYLTGLDADESRRVNAWAVERVGVDHHVPLALEPSAEGYARQRLLTDFISMVAFTHATRGEQAAGELSLRLAHDYGTRRTVRARGGARDDAAPVVLAQIRYLQESVRFEKALARYLSEDVETNVELGKMARAVWRKAERHPEFRWYLDSFGSDDPRIVGAVGVSYDALADVVFQGNLRERMNFLFLGLSSGLIYDLLGVGVVPPGEIGIERADRVRGEAQTRYMEERKRIETADLSNEERARAYREAEEILRSNFRASEVHPPLSEAERRMVGDAEILPWVPGESYYGIRLDSDFQRRSEATGGLIRTGTSGSTYHFMRTALYMNEIWGLDLDPVLIRLAAIGGMVSAGHHTFH